jgi:hypothetical protein
LQNNLPLDKEKNPAYYMNMGKKLLIISSSVFAYLMFPLSALALTTTQDSGSSINPCDNDAGIGKILCNLASKGFGSVIQSIIVFIVVLAVIVALLYLLYGGIKWITSKGEKTEVEAARNHITAAIAGLIIVILAVFILNLILAAFGISFFNLSLPTIGG